MRQMPTQLVFWKHLTVLREDAKHLRDRIIGLAAQTSRAVRVRTRLLLALSSYPGCPGAQAA